MKHWCLGRDYIETCGMLRQNIIKCDTTFNHTKSYSKKVLNLRAVLYHSPEILFSFLQQKSTSWAICLSSLWLSSVPD